MLELLKYLICAIYIAEQLLIIAEKENNLIDKSYQLGKIEAYNLLYKEIKEMMK